MPEQDMGAGVFSPWAMAQLEAEGGRRIWRRGAGPWRDPRAAGSVNGRGAGEMLCSLLKNEQQKQRQVHGDAEDGAGEVLATGSVGTSE